MSYLMFSQYLSFFVNISKSDHHFSGRAAAVRAMLASLLRDALCANLLIQQ